MLDTAQAWHSVDGLELYEAGDTMSYKLAKSYCVTVQY